MSDATITQPDPARSASDGYEFEFSGGDPALDFTNTISRRRVPEESRDRLIDYGRLVSWGRQAGVISERDEKRLRSAGEARPRAAVAALRRAVALREAMFSVFAASARGDRVPKEPLDALNAALPDALAALRVGPDGDRFTWRFAHDDAELVPMLSPVLRAAAELLTSEDLVRVRECDSETCFWLFLDQSRNGTRRWCDMKSCGNRAKARRHYLKEKASGKGESPRGGARRRSPG